tara:strand:+ start:8775 stop:9425 length:651 start_codon:yes stop_codon:yes gene_type:complete
MNEKALEHVELFHKLAAPLPKTAYKDLKLGGRTMTVIDAYHIVSRLTQVFGLAGFGWGVEVEEFRQEDGNIAAVGHLWYIIEGKKYTVSAIGDARIFKGNVAEGMKKAQTNLISKASSLIGIGLSVYQGKGIDDPYLDQEYAKEDREPPKLDAGDWKKAATLKGKALNELGVCEREKLIEWRNRVMSQSLSDEAFRLWHLVGQMAKEISKAEVKAA